MAEELAHAGAGAVPEGTGAAAGEPIARAQEGAAGDSADAQSSPAEQSTRRVDLTEMEEFRNWQRRSDQRIAQAQAAAAEAQRRAEEAERRAEEQERRARVAQLEDGDPAELIKFYEERERQLREQVQRQAQAQAEAAKVDAEVMEYLERVGLAPDTPGLDFSGGRTPEGVQKLYRSAGEILALRAGEVAKSKVRDTEAAAREARQQALVESGAARVSSAPGGGPGTSLRAEYEAKRDQHKGDWRTIAQLQADYRKRGLDI